jgi:hypothetical protein
VGDGDDGDAPSWPTVLKKECLGEVAGDRRFSRQWRELKGGDQEDSKICRSGLVVPGAALFGDTFEVHRVGGGEGNLSGTSQNRLSWMQFRRLCKKNECHA